jgi:hypothetical protein
MFSSSPDENLKQNVHKAPYPVHSVHVYYSSDPFDDRSRPQHEYYWDEALPTGSRRSGPSSNIRSRAGLQGFRPVFLRDLNELPPAPVVITLPVPVSGFREWLTSSNKIATQLSSFMPMVVVCTTFLAVVSDALDTNWSHVLSALVVVACAAVRCTSRSGLHAVLILLRAECAFVARIALAIVWGLLEDLLSLSTHCVELGLTVSDVLLAFYHIC